MALRGAAVILILCVLAEVGTRPAPATLRLPIHAHAIYPIKREEIEAEIRRAARYFAPAGIELELVSIDRDPRLYIGRCAELHLYVVERHQDARILGWSTFPADCFAGRSDGVWLTRAGMESDWRGRVTAHEIGHWLGLEHRADLCPAPCRCVMTVSLVEGCADEAEFDANEQAAMRSWLVERMARARWSQFLLISEE